jgi:hypothetical protein
MDPATARRKIPRHLSVPFIHGLETKPRGKRFLVFGGEPGDGVFESRRQSCSSDYGSRNGSNPLGRSTRCRPLPGTAGKTRPDGEGFGGPPPGAEATSLVPGPGQALTATTASVGPRK